MCFLITDTDLFFVVAHLCYTFTFQVKQMYKQRIYLLIQRIKRAEFFFITTL